MITLRQGLSLGFVSFALVSFLGLEGCSSTAPKSDVVSPSVAQTNACSPGVECIAVAGDPCDPCGACPGASTSMMTKAEYNRLTSAPACAATHKTTDTRSPTCPPCT